ncbi:MAG: HAMP domain-containing histidine kinase [Defluviitaleaceae bacterium]|nr:HAMP domain-containing histidine kinase [Defluviitaleaceae bacterium]
MKKFSLGLFGKIFLYTLLFLSLIVGVFSWFYSEQLQTAFEVYERQRRVQELQPLIAEIGLGFGGDISEIAESFRLRNESFEFSIQSYEGMIIFETPYFYYTPQIRRGFGLLGRMARGNGHFVVPSANGTGSHFISVMQTNDINFIEQSRIIPITLALFGISAVFAFVLAKMIARPIKKLALDTALMSALADIDPPPARNDEIGSLAEDVHCMYTRLKETIGNQRYFFSAASHELKTPIAGTTAIIEAMLEGLIEDDEKNHYLVQCLDMMNAQSKLISEILEIVRYNDGQIKQKPEAIELEPFVMAMLPIYEAQAARKNQRMSVDIPQGQEIFADRTMFSKVLSNVIMNAITNAPDESEIRIYCENNRLCVLNTNTKIPEDELPKLFEPFYRLDKARNRGHGRSGLGLAIVKKTLDTMDIKFGLENSNEGVVFFIMLD